MVSPASDYGRRQAAFSRIGFLTCVALGLIGTPDAHAQTVVYDNGAPDNVSGAFSSNRAGLFVSDTFTFANTATFDRVDWFGLYGIVENVPTTDNFTISLYNTANGVPVTTVAPIGSFAVGNNVNRTATGTFSGGGAHYTNFAYSAVFSSSVTLTAGTYALSIVDDTPSVSDYWGWLSSNQTGTYYERQSPSGASSARTGDRAFRLISSASAPEPSALALLGLCLPFGGAAKLLRSKCRRYGRTA